jgi:hypothetical protein
MMTDAQWDRMHPFPAKDLGPVAAEYTKKIGVYFRAEVIVLVC